MMDYFYNSLLPMQITIFIKPMFEFLSYNNYWENKILSRLNRWLYNINRLWSWFRFSVHLVFVYSIKIWVHISLLTKPSGWWIKSIIRWFNKVGRINGLIPILCFIDWVVVVLHKYSVKMDVKSWDIIRALYRKWCCTYITWISFHLWFSKHYTNNWNGAKESWEDCLKLLMWMNPILQIFRYE